jgi:hypothetical protein
LSFNITGSSTLAIKYRSHFVVDNTTLIDTTMIKRGVSFESIVDKTSMFNVVQLGKTLFSKKISIDVSHLIINGDLIDPNDEKNH